MGWGMTRFCFFPLGVVISLPQHRREGLSLITITPVGMEKPYAITN